MAPQRRRPERRWLDAPLVADGAVKLVTVALLLWAVASPNLPQFQGKAFTARAVLYPVALLALPVPRSAEAATAYGDTLGDLALGMVGGAVAAILTARLPTLVERGEIDDPAPAS